MNELVTSRTDPEAGLVKRVGSPPASTTRRTSASTAGGRASSRRWRSRRGRWPTSTCSTACSRSTPGTTGRTVAEVVADTKYGTHANYAGARAAGRSGRASRPTARRATAGASRRRPLRLRGRRRPLPLPRRPGPDPPGRLEHGRPDRRRHLPRPAEGLRRLPGAGPVLPGGAAARRSCAPTTAGCATASRPTCAPGRARRRLRRRAPWVETANAELKERHGLRRARCRGRDKVQIQALGAAMAYDVKKLAQLRAPAPPRGARAARVGLSSPLLAHRAPVSPAQPGLSRRLETRQGRQGAPPALYGFGRPHCRLQQRAPCKHFTARGGAAIPRRSGGTAQGCRTQDVHPAYAARWQTWCRPPRTGRATIRSGGPFGTAAARPGKRRHQSQTAMRPIAVVVGDVLLEHALEVPLVAHEHVVEPLRAQRPDDPLGEGVRPRRPERGQERGDPQPSAHAADRRDIMTGIASARGPPPALASAQISRPPECPPPQWDGNDAVAPAGAPPLGQRWRRAVMSQARESSRTPAAVSCAASVARSASSARARAAASRSSSIPLVSPSGAKPNASSASAPR